jgi:hypothetical protein
VQLVPSLSVSTYVTTDDCNTRDTRQRECRNYTGESEYHNQREDGLFDSERRLFSGTQDQHYAGPRGRGGHMLFIREEKEKGLVGYLIKSRGEKNRTRQPHILAIQRVRD